MTHDKDAEARKAALTAWKEWKPDEYSGDAHVAFIAGYTIALASRPAQASDAPIDGLHFVKSENRSCSLGEAMETLSACEKASDAQAVPVAWRYKTGHKPSAGYAYVHGAPDEQAMNAEPLFVHPPASREVADAWVLAMRVMQSDLYRQLDDKERAVCDALVRQNPHAQPTAPAACPPAPKE